MLALLKAVHVSKSHESGLFFKTKHRILENVSLELEPGQTIGLMGDSGSGKTTLCRIMAGLERPSSGYITFREKDVRSLSKKEFYDFRRAVQMIFQDTEGSLNPRKNIERSIHEVLWLLNVPKKQWTDRTLEILDTVGLSEELLCRNPCQISGGQNQRVALGRVLLLNPKIMILDEPTSALDLSVQAQILNLLTDLQKERKLAYLLVSHQPEVVKFMTREVYVLEGGRLVQRV